MEFLLYTITESTAFTAASLDTIAFTVTLKVVVVVTLKVDFTMSFMVYRSATIAVG